MSDFDSMIQASAARYLIDGGQEDAASILLSCQFELVDANDSWMNGNDRLEAVNIEFTGPRVAYEILRQKQDPTTRQIREAIDAVLPYGHYVKDHSIRVELVDIDPDWRTELLEIARGKGVHNQAIGAHNARTWKNLYFRSQSEIRIAEALDQKGALFFANCKARLNTPPGRSNKEADFLVCVDGKWGVLEVDGEPFHPPSRTVADHERDRLFRAYGIRVVEHYDATRCFENPGSVVQEFLGILAKS